MEKRILAIGAHIGDMELTAGGILAQCAVSGGHIATLALTAGEKAAPPDCDLAEFRKQKVSEAEAFTKILGGRSYVFDYEDGILPDNEEVRWKTADIIRAEKPDLIITHHDVSMHKDHECCHRIVKDAWFYAALPSFKRELPAHFAHLYFAENWEDAVEYHPYIYREISEEAFKLWQKAVVTHEFVTKSKSFEYFEYYSHLMRVRGIEARKRYAETFECSPEEIRVIQSI